MNGFPWLFATYILATSIQLVLILLLLLRVGKKDLSKQTNQIPNKEEMKKYILWYSFYSNPEDPRGWVPKAFGWGFTPNFRSRKSIYYMITLIISTIATTIIFSFYMIHQYGI